MRQPTDAETDEPTLDDLLWELDVTTARSEPAAAVSTGAARDGSRPRREPKALKAPEPSRAPRPAKRVAAAKASKRGRFHRPELQSPWERIAGNRVVQIVSGAVLVGGTATLVVVALGR